MSFYLRILIMRIDTSYKKRLFNHRDNLCWVQSSLTLFFLAKWLFKLEELVLHLEARFNSDWCIAFLLAFCLSSRIFNSVGIEWLGLEDKNNSALWSEFFLQRLFLIKGRWFITFLGRGNPVPCYLNMHFPEEIERTKIVAVDTVICDQAKYSILISLKNHLT